MCTRHQINAARAKRQRPASSPTPLSPRPCTPDDHNSQDTLLCIVGVVTWGAYLALSVSCVAFLGPCVARQSNLGRTAAALAGIASIPITAGALMMLPCIPPARFLDDNVRRARASRMCMGCVAMAFMAVVILGPGSPVEAFPGWSVAACVDIGILAAGLCFIEMRVIRTWDTVCMLPIRITPDVREDRTRAIILCALVVPLAIITVALGDDKAVTSDPSVRVYMCVLVCARICECALPIVGIWSHNWNASPLVHDKATRTVQWLFAMIECVCSSALITYTACVCEGTQFDCAWYATVAYGTVMLVLAIVDFDVSFRSAWACDVKMN